MTDVAVHTIRNLDPVITIGIVWVVTALAAGMVKFTMSMLDKHTQQIEDVVQEVRNTVVETLSDFPRRTDIDSSCERGVEAIQKLADNVEEKIDATDAKVVRLLQKIDNLEVTVHQLLGAVETMKALMSAERRNITIEEFLNALQDYRKGGDKR